LDINSQAMIGLPHHKLNSVFLTRRSETEFALNYWGLPCPPPFLDVGLERPVCLVDHNQASQMTAGIDKAWIRGIIDHHALQAGTVVTDAPIYVDIRPWGSACTIIAHMFVAQHRLMTRTTAGMLLCGILSDTLNMRSPTTTNADRVLVGFVSIILPFVHRVRPVISSCSRYLV
jgi:manganese-dependent inorganic pyrophosphatase